MSVGFTGFSSKQIGTPSAAATLTALIGSSTLAAGAMIYGAGTSTLSTLTIGAANTVLTSSGTAPQWSTSLALTSTIASKQASAAGISLDHNSATGNFTYRLSPANLTANRRATFPDADFTLTGGGTLALGGFTLTVPATGTSALLGTANVFTALNTITTASAPGAPGATSVILGNGSVVAGTSLAVGAAPSSTTYALLPAATTGVSSLRLAHGTAPSSPVDGDVWTTTSGVFARINGSTVGPFGAGTGTIGGSIAANQVAIGSGTDTISGSSSWTATTTSGALLVALAAGTTTATASTTIQSGSATSTGTLAASAIIKGWDWSLTPNSGGTNGASSQYIGGNVTLANTASSSNRYGTSTLTGFNVNSTFSAATTTGTVLTGMTGLQVNPSVVMTGASGTSTISSIYGLAVVPGTFSAASGGTTTLNVYAGLYLGSITTSGAGTTNIGTRYGIFQDDTSAVSLFRGNVGVGNTAPVAATALALPASTTSRSSLRFADGTAPSSPGNGDMWQTTSGLFQRINGTTHQFAMYAGTAAFTAVQTIDLNAAAGASGITETGSSLILRQADATAQVIIAETWGSTTGTSLRTYNANGTRVSPTATANGSAFFNITARGYDGSVYTGSQAVYTMAAGSLWSGSNYETIHTWSGTPASSTTSAEWMRLKGAALLIGATSLVGSERFRATGGSAPATPGSTDVLIGAGQVRSGDTSSTSITSQGGITHNSATLLFVTTALSNGAAGNTATLTNAPASGDPTKWVAINDNGTTRYIPAW